MEIENEGCTENAELIKRIEELREEQRELQIERIKWSQASASIHSADKFELDRKECAALEKTIESLLLEKTHLISDINRVHHELDEVAKVRSDVRMGRKEQVIHHNHQVMSIKNSTQRLRREIFTILKEEGIPDSTAQDLYVQLQLLGLSIESGSPAAMRKRRMKKKKTSEKL